ncbi:MAG: cation transporter [Armatimonadetes bacterium]|nr:cation transporter [Armatimonadota bacterium]
MTQFNTTDPVASPESGTLRPPSSAPRPSPSSRQNPPAHTAAHIKTAAACLSLLVSAFLVVLKMGAGLLSGSVSVLSDALDSGVDVLAATLAFFSVRAAEAPADTRHPYGHGKAENLAAALQALLIFAAAGTIIYQAYRRLVSNALPEHLGLTAGVMGVSAIIHLVVTRHLWRVAAATESPALAADARHLSTNILTATGVFLGLLLIEFTGQAWIDPVIGLVVGGFIFKMGWDLSREAIGHLMDQRLPEEEIALLRDVLDAEPRVLGYHRVRARRAGSQRHIDLHLLVDPEMSLRAAHELAEEVEDRIRAAFPGVLVVTHVEPATDEELAVEVSEPGIWKGVRRESRPPS